MDEILKILNEYEALTAAKKEQENKRWLNYQTGAVKLSIDELVEIKKAMKSIQRDNFIDR